MYPITKTLEFNDVAHGELDHVVKEIKQTINGSMDITVKGVVLPKDISEPEILAPDNSDLKGWAGIGLDRFNADDVSNVKISIARRGDDPLENNQKCTIGLPKSRIDEGSLGFKPDNLPYMNWWEPNDDNTVVVVYVERSYNRTYEVTGVKTKAIMYSYLSEEQSKTLLELNGQCFASTDTDLICKHAFLPEPKVIETVPIFAGASTAIVLIEVNDGDKGIVDQVMGWE